MYMDKTLHASGKREFIFHIVVIVLAPKFLVLKISIFLVPMLYSILSLVTSFYVVCTRIYCFNEFLPLANLMPYFLVPTFSGPEATVLELADTIFARRIASSIEQKEVISSTFYSYSYKLVL